jgi:hypothetical protein
LFWVRTGWTFQGISKTQCICNWVASHVRVRKLYRETVTEQAQFTCDCPSRTETRTREHTKLYEVDSPGMNVLPTQGATTYGSTFQAGDDTGKDPRFWPKAIGCLCPPPAP